MWCGTGRESDGDQGWFALGGWEGEDPIAQSKAEVEGCCAGECLEEGVGGGFVGR